MRTIREAYLRASSFLKERGVEEAGASAELLLRHVLRVNRTKLLVMWDESLEDDAFDRLWEMLQRRADGEPVQYIMGEAYFYGRPFQVNKAVLIPRPETELLAERIVLLGREFWGAEGSPRVVDIGTGSGGIAVTLASECPAWQVAASDISPAALEVARGNARANGVEDRILFLEGDLLEPAAREWGRIDILVSNPPYICTADLDGLQREVRDYEPHLALDGGPDGLVLYRRMLAQMAEFDVWPRLVGFECGMGQAQELSRLIQETGRWSKVMIVDDYAGIERHVIASR